MTHEYNPNPNLTLTLTLTLRLMAKARLNGPALAYIHKPKEIDSSSVLKRWHASGHRRILPLLSVKKKRRPGKIAHLSNC